MKESTRKVRSSHSSSDVVNSSHGSREDVCEFSSTSSDSTTHPGYVDFDMFEPDKFRATFRPGQDLGLLGDWGSGLVTEVEEQGQAGQLGVKRGWMMTHIDEGNYSEKLLDEKRQNSNVPFEVVFEDLSENIPWNNEGRDCCLCLCLCKGLVFQRWFRTESLHAMIHGNSRSRFSHRRDRCCSGIHMICSCGIFGQNFAAIALDGDELPKSRFYSCIPADHPPTCRDFIKNLCVLPVHFHRSGAMNRLTKLNMVSDAEKKLMMRIRHLRHPKLQIRGVAPILNFIVWRRSSLFVLMTLALLFTTFDIHSTIISQPHIQWDDRAAQAKLEPFRDWRREHSDGFPAYIKHATELMFKKCYAETSWIFCIKKRVRTGLKLLTLCPLIFANITWIDWGKSVRWLRAVWLIMFSLPFVTFSVPNRLLINVENLIEGDIFLLKDEVMIHYNLNNTLRNKLEEASSFCGKDPIGKFEGMLHTVAWTRSQAEFQLNGICKIVGMVSESALAALITNWNDQIHAADRKCHLVQEFIEHAKKVSKERRPKSKKRLTRAKAAVKEVCSNVEQLAAFMEKDDLEMSEKQREVHDLAKVLMSDGLAGLSELLNRLVGAASGLASFGSLWSAALSLGPGVIRGTMRAKSIVPEASLPGAFIVLLPWIYAPLAWSLFNLIVQIFGNWSLLLAAASVAFYPMLLSLVGMCFFIDSPQRHTDVTDMMKILKRVELLAVTLTAALAAFWVYQAHAQINAAKDKHPILKHGLDFLMKESRKAFDDGKKWATEHIMHFDLPDWISKHPIFAMSCLLNTLTPLIVFYQKLLLTSMMSTDWILRRVSNERRFEFLATNRDHLPCDVSNAEIEELSKSRIARLDALVIAFGGAVEEYQGFDVNKERWTRARK